MSKLREMIEALGLQQAPSEYLVQLAAQYGIDPIAQAQVAVRAAESDEQLRQRIKQKWSGGASSDPISDLRRLINGSDFQFAAPRECLTDPGEIEAQQALMRVWARYLQHDASMREVRDLVHYYCGHQFEEVPLAPIVDLGALRQFEGGRLAIKTEPWDRGRWLVLEVRVPPNPDRIKWLSARTKVERARAKLEFEQACRQALTLAELSPLGEQ